MLRLFNIFFLLWLVVVFSNSSIAQEIGEDFFSQNLRQANDLIEETGDSLRSLLDGINNSADLTDLQKAKIDLVRSKLNTLGDLINVLSPVEPVAADTNRFPGTLINEAQNLIIQSRPDEGIPLIMKFLDSVDSQSDSAVYAKIYLAEAYRQKQEHNKGIAILYEILRNSNISVANRQGRRIKMKSN